LDICLLRYHRRWGAPSVLKQHPESEQAEPVGGDDHNRHNLPQIERRYAAVDVQQWLKACIKAKPKLDYPMEEIMFYAGKTLQDW